MLYEGFQPISRRAALSSYAHVTFVRAILQLPSRGAVVATAEPARAAGVSGPSATESLEDVVQQLRMFTGVGIMVADRYGAAIVAPSPEFRMAPARRKALTLRFARAAAGRLMRLDGPEFM